MENNSFTRSGTKRIPVQNHWQQESFERRRTPGVALLGMHSEQQDVLGGKNEATSPQRVLDSFFKRECCSDRLVVAEKGSGYTLLSK